MRVVTGDEPGLIHCYEPKFPSGFPPGVEAAVGPDKCAVTRIHTSVPRERLLCPKHPVFHLLTAPPPSPGNCFHGLAFS